MVREVHLSEKIWSYMVVNLFELNHLDISGEAGLFEVSSGSSLLEVSHRSEKYKLLIINLKKKPLFISLIINSNTVLKYIPLVWLNINETSRTTWDITKYSQGCVPCVS